MVNYSVREKLDQDFYLSIKKNKDFLILGVVSSLIIWLIFKYYFPNPFFAYDSYQYLRDASKDINVSFRPIGYSKFILMMGAISKSPYLIVSVQFFFSQFSFLYFFITLRQVLGLGKPLSYILFAITCLNPLFIVTSNFILSDILFTGLSLIWFVQLLRIIYGCSKWITIIQSILLLILFSLRYNSLFFPIISTLAIILSPFKVKWKLLSLFIQYFLLFIFVEYTRMETRKVAGVSLFSPMSSWKVANDALYMYQNIFFQEKKETIPQEFTQLNYFVNNYYYSHQKKLKEETEGGIFFIFSFYSPLKQYLYSKYGAPVDFKKFAVLSPLYKRYGYYLIKSHPIEFVNFVVFPNFIKYWSPNCEIFDNKKFSAYNPSTSEDLTIIGKFIKYKKNSADSLPGDNIISQFYLFSLLFSISHILFILTSVSFIILKKNREFNYKIQTLIYLIFAVWILNFFFGVFSGPIVIRYEYFIFFMEVFSISFFTRSTDKISYN
ncbi:hypothetical protein [Chitinophaga sancti]|uniref:Dolichyl-phosphate-mannose-protein mannosyltransferase n=1 Tax=Chitinophaga sancti TaxID=1004 RepID=A0A1K1T3G0_9BACT|nr:hypothetical protein [Chitinophaga sancti]WQD59543.1 hypothetical protein U0033_16745 [Chitinophaga sancti]WQG88323.1 hypothetical protein SR876_25720 [Chitinophaga sancti]SFW91122.1 hypothetical protein SAMN05661012_06731 [Chitinophaga sancti]